MLDTSSSSSSSFSIFYSILTAIISIVLVLTVFIVMRLKYPIIIRANDKKRKVSNDVALFAASFNPIHNGHVAILRRIVARHSKVYCVIGFNPKKKYPVTPEERKRLVEKCIEADSELKDRVEVVLVKGYIWKFATRNNVNVMYRGIRTWKKDGDEETHLHFQNLLGPILLGCVMPPETRFVESEPKYTHISSSKIRSAVEKGAVSIENNVPKIILKDVKSLWKSI